MERRTYIPYDVRTCMHRYPHSHTHIHTHTYTRTHIRGTWYGSDSMVDAWLGKLWSNLGIECKVAEGTYTYVSR